jgi:hypothetical protein
MQLPHRSVGEGLSHLLREGQRKLGADAIIVLHQGVEYAGTVGTANSYTSANVFCSYIGNTFTGTGYASTTGTSVSVPLFFGKASITMIKWRT